MKQEATRDRRNSVASLISQLGVPAACRGSVTYGRPRRNVMADLHNSAPGYGGWLFSHGFGLADCADHHRVSDGRLRKDSTAMALIEL